MDGYKILLQSNDSRGFEEKDATVTVTYTRKEYDAENPTWVSLTMAIEYTGMPCAGDLTHNYHDSIVSQDEKIVFVCKGPFRFSRLCLLVDGMWKDGKTIESYNLNIDVNIPAQISKIDPNHRFSDLDRMLSDVVASRCLVNQPTREAVVQHYDGVRWSYKVIDYGNPKLSLYGIVMAITKNQSTIIEAIDFDNLSDF